LVVDVDTKNRSGTLTLYKWGEGVTAAFVIEFHKDMTNAEIQKEIEKWAFYLSDCFMTDEDLAWAKRRMEEPHRSLLPETEIPDKLLENGLLDALIPITLESFRRFLGWVFYEPPPSRKRRSDAVLSDVRSNKIVKRPRIN
jgi:hypothetical protein